ncbi:g6670 [Coccomyxa viridis]|uniref:G6670 protein n=1 Tax=Coccomyxa viridis TaxID=1274662 RepID=A0ABP1FYE0_9CHLO
MWQQDVVLDVITAEQLHVLVQTVVDRTILPSVVNTQILSPFKNADPAVKMAFPGVNVNDREQANVRPPSPSLCVGNGFIVETTDLAFKVYNIKGEILAGPVSLVDFFGHSVTGSFSDAACVYDAADTKRFYITALNYELDQGVHLGNSQLLIASSISSNPADGFLGPYAVPAMGLDPEDPTKVLPGLEACKSPNPSSLKNGCLGTAPSIGMDRFGLWAGVNLFQINSQVVGGEYAAPLLLGISKRSLLEGQASTPAYAAYTGWHADTMFSLVPSKTQGGKHTTSLGGTAYVLTSGPTLAVHQAPVTRLFAWAITNTSTLAQASFPEAGLPVLSNRATLESYAFANPHNNSVTVTQPAGGVALDTHDSRLTQVSNLDGMLWAAAATAVLINKQGSPLEGAIWWAVSTAFSPDGTFKAAIDSQGYVSAMGNHVVNPVITPSAASGTPSGVMAAALVGPDYKYTAVWTPINMQLGAGALHTPAQSTSLLTGPQGDNAQGTLLHGGSAAVTDEYGVAWVTSQWAAGGGTKFCSGQQLLQFQTPCENWGTYISQVSPGSWP